MFRRARKSDWWQKAALIAILAILQQAFVFAAAEPMDVFPDGKSGGLELASICGSPSTGDNSSHQPHGTPQDCQMCPLCQALASAGATLLPQQVAIPVRSAAVIYRESLPEAAILSRAVTLAAQPRGPPSDLTDV